MPKDRPYVVVDFGSRCSPRQRLTHRDLLRQHKCHIIGVDLKPGRNVDVVMKQPYRLPLRRNGVDVIISGQAFEHTYRSSGYLSSNSPGSVGTTITGRSGTR
jgi:hypothetical protein